MRGFWLVLAGAVWALGTPFTAAAQEGFRVGYIDSQAILMEAPGAMEAQQEYDRQMQSFGQEIETMGQEIDSLIEAYQQQQTTLLPTVREAREAEIRQREIRYQQRIEEMEREAVENRQRLVEPILNQMSQVIESMRTEGSYAIIFDVAGQSIIAADPSLDLTDEVIRRLHETAGSSTP